MARTTAKSDERSLLQRAADNARTATATLAEIREDLLEAKREKNRAQEALNEANRMLDVQQARHDAQSRCVQSYLSEVHELCVAGAQSVMDGGSGEVPN